MNAVRKTIVRKAAELLEADVLELKRAHTLADGRWYFEADADRRAYEDVVRRTTLAQALRRIAEEE